jgi:UDP-N-acetylmuramate--alanine ligase
MKILEKNIKNKIHFVGIGGIGMSGIAEVLFSQGYEIQGSDLSNNSNTKRLKKKGIKIYLGHSPQNLKDVNILVVSSAIKNNNSELKFAKKNKILIYKRSDMLAALMKYNESIAVTGSHGKTTTTSLISSVLESANLDPTTIIGGIVNQYKSTTRIGKSNWMVVEADESDGSLVNLFPKIAVITNINKEHMDFYKTYKNLKKYFFYFINNIPFDGAAIYCKDNLDLKRLILKSKKKNKISYGLQKGSDVRATNILINEKGSFFDINIKKTNLLKKEVIKKVQLNVLGKHNIENSLAAVTVAKILNISTFDLKNAFKKFKGVKRRFTLVCNFKGIKIIDDYAHHPEEIKATLKIAKLITKNKIIVIFQPHRFSRTKFLYSDFVKVLTKADYLFISKIYSAGEKPLKSINSLKLVKDISNKGIRNVYYLDKLNKLNSLLSPFFKKENLIIFMGAGSISQWASELVEKNSDK